MSDVSLTSRLVRGASVMRADDAPSLVRREAATWVAMPELVEELFDERGLKLSQWLQSGRAEVVKDGVHRTVYLLQLDAGRFYLKHYKPARFPKRLQNLLRPCRASLEWIAARRIAGLGIPTFEPVAAGYCRRASIIADNYLVTREIPNAVPLDDFVLASQGNRSAPFVVRNSIAVELGDLIARLHAGRIVHSDLHAGNILVRIGANGHTQLWLIDLHPVRQGPRLSVGSIEHNLSLLNNFFAGIATPSDRLRFFRSYIHTLESVSSTTPLAGTTSKRRSLRALSRRFEAYCAKAAQQGLRKADQKWITGNRRLIIADSANRRCRGVSASGFARVNKLRDDPEMLFAPGAVRQWYEQSPTRKSALVDISGDGEPPKLCGVTVYRSNKPRFANRLFGGRWPSRRIWEAGHALLRRSIRCPQPLLFVEFTDHLGMHQQYLLTETVPNASRLSDFLLACGKSSSTGREALLERCLNRLAYDIRRMHAGGIDHRALTADNILVSATEDACEIYFWGLDAVRIRRRLTRKQMNASLAALNASLQASSPVRLSHRLKFLRRLLQSRVGGTLSKVTWKNAWREIARESELLPAGRNADCRAFPYC